MRQASRIEILDDGSQLVEGVIWIHPDRVSGTPCFAKTRVPIQNLFDYLESGETLEEFLKVPHDLARVKRSYTGQVLREAGVG